MTLDSLPPSFMLHHGDCLDVLATLPADSFDCSVEDPPAGIGFMGKPWDSYKSYEPRTPRGVEVQSGLKLLGFDTWERGFVAFMVEAHVAKLRVLKPGAFVLTWALPKTADLAGLALRLAGFEVQDSIVHLFGQGMSKAGDLGKKIDKMLGAEREVVGKVAQPRRVTSATDALGGSWQDAPDLTAPATPEAERWTDWSSQLAPGHEQWLLARKPTRLTYAEQVLTHGCGALNIGACRVPRGEGEAGTRCTNRDESGACRGHRNAGVSTSGETFHGPDTSPAGSWPKNVVLTEGGPACPVAELDRQSGATLSRGGSRGAGGQYGRYSPIGAQPDVEPGFGDTGGASRYFTRFRYVPKASDREVPGGDAKGNRHPTHKHPELMRWLIKLVCPKGGRVLDSFAGSGTTGVAAAAEGATFVGIEADADSHATALARIAYAYAAAADGKPEAYSPKRAAKLRTKRAVKGNP